MKPLADDQTATVKIRLTGTASFLAIFLLGSSILSGCISLAPSAKLPEAVEEMPPDFGTELVESMYQPLDWWSVFADEQLNQLIDSALTANLDLVSAVARIDEVRAQLRATRGAKFPSVTATANGSRTDSPANTGAFSLFGGGAADSSGGSGVSRFNTTTYSTSLGFAYELDFWGRIRNDTRAAVNDARASESDFETVRLGVIAETISTYFEIVDIRSRIALSVETLDVLTERVGVAEDRYGRGLITSFELYQLRQDYRNTQATLPDLESQLTDAEGRLAVLLGRYPGQLNWILDHDLTPTLSFESIPSGLPADLLVQRPDVRSAALRFESARYRIGARKAELFPSISLTGSVGTQAANLGDLINTIDQWTLNLAAGLTAPLFQGGRLRASVDVAEAQYKQLAAAYAKTVLTAYQEAFSALDGYDEQRQRYSLFLAQLEEAQASANLQADRYRSGVAGYSDYLDALRSLHQVETALSGAGRQLALARLAVHRSLGGGWTNDGLAPQFDLVRAAVPTSANN